MYGIPVYAPGAEDFSNNGLGLMLATECTIEETRNGMYELKMVQPITSDMRWMQVQPGCILKAAAPVRESPLYELTAGSAGTATVTRSIYKVTTNGGRLRLRQKPSTSAKILGSYVPGTQVVQLEDNGSGWYRVSVCKGGATGWMYAGYLTFVKSVTDTITSAKPVTRNAVKVQPAREQLFRVYSVENDTETGLQTAMAMHIFYDLRGNPVNEDYKPNNADAATAAQRVFSKAMIANDFELNLGAISGKVTGEYGYMGVAEALLDPDSGIAAQCGALLVRDNYDVFLIPDDVRDMGVTIRRGKNLVGVTVTTDDSDAVTRIIPRGKKKNGDPLYLSGTIYVDSARIGDYPVIRAKLIDYDVQVSDADDAEFKTEAAARAELKRLAQADFTAGADLPTYGMEVDFVNLADTEDYADYAALQSVHMHDTVTVIDELIGLTAKLRVTGYTWNVLTEQYDSVTLGDIQALQQTTYGFSLAEGSVSGSKLIPGSVDASVALRDLSLQYAKISVAAIEQLNANAITALRAHINELVAGSVTTDQLYADLAKIAVAQITTANIQNANIDWAQIAELSAQVAEIAKAQINTANINSANIDWAQIGTLSAQIGSIAEAKIKAAEITSAQISDLEAVMAEIFSASIGSADIGFAQIKDLVTDQAIIQEGVGGKLYIARLAVTEANMVSLTVGELVVKGSDGRFYSVSVDESGNVTTALKQIGNDDVEDVSINAGEKIIEGSVTAACLNAQDIFADNAIISNLIAANLDVAALFAREAFIAQLNTSDIRGNQYLKITVSELTEQITAAQDAADAAQQTANQNAADMAGIVTQFNTDIESLQTQIDGSITTWFYEVPPTPDNPPASGWTTTDDKNVHLGDLYYDTVTGYCYRWQVKNNAYSWQRITDTDVTKALSDAAAAQDTADAKRRVFVAQPVPPYDAGDLWVQGAGGDILRCQVAKSAGQSYLASDWVLASRYTDDTAANAAQQTANQNASNIATLTTRVGKAEVAIDAANAEITLRASKEEVKEQIEALDAAVAGKNTVWRQDDAPENAQAYDLWVQPSAGLTWQAIPAEEGLPVFRVDSNGVLSYEYPAGVTGPEYSIDSDGYLVISDVPGFTVTMASDGRLTPWRLVQDGELRQAIEDGAESADEKITAMYTEVSVRQDAFDVQIQRKVDAEELQVYMRYGASGVLELGRSDSRYVSQTSDSGFVVLQDGQPMTSIVRNTVSAPVVEARRMFTLGNYSIRVGTGGGIIFN